MKSTIWARQTLSMAVVFAILMTFSMVTLALPGSTVGELTLIRSASTGETSPVTINGEAAKSGRTVFSSSTITTPEGTEAIINFGKAGKIQIGSDTTFTLAADSLGGNLTKGSLTVLNSADPVAVKTAAGDMLTVKAGETASAGSKTAARKPGPAGLDWWVWAAIAGGVVAVVLIATHDSGTTSPVR